MPWKDGYTISDETTLPDDAMRWPDGTRCCVSVTVDLSVASGPAGIPASDLASPRAQFGARDGLEQVRRVLRQFGLRATFAVPAVIARAFPETIRSLLAEEHEIAAEGLLHEDVSSLSREEERRRIDQATSVLADVAGQRPAGWYSLPRQGDPFAGGTISPHTMDLLLEAGYDWFGNGLADDIPHYCHHDDQFFLHFPAKGTGLEHADSLRRNWRAEFAAQYRRGRLFHMTLHPYAVGFGHRVRLLEDVCRQVRSVPAIWNATGSAIAAYWRETWPAEKHLRLEQSVWQDYPGSLS
jgi:peptidoglycan/xylan/chitin deacetylase (PgdA/CDA1 family)